jgi:nitroreductase
MTDLNLHLHDALHWRYATKQFDPLRSLTATDWSSLQQALLLSPSSYGLQPWKFVVVTDPALKQQLPAACWGQTQPRDCSHFVVFAARRTVDPQFVQQYLQRIAEIRAVPVTALEGLGTAINGKASRMGSEQLAWNSRQCYIALGFLLQAAALMPAPWKAFRRIDWIRC